MEDSPDLQPQPSGGAPVPVIPTLEPSPAQPTGQQTTPAPSAPAAAEPTPEEQPYRQIYLSPDAPNLTFFYADGDEGHFENGMLVCNTPDESARMEAAIVEMSGSSRALIHKVDEEVDRERIKALKALMAPESQAVRGGAHSMTVPQLSRQERDERLRAMEELGMPITETVEVQQELVNAAQAALDNAE